MGKKKVGTKVKANTPITLKRNNFVKKRQREKNGLQIYVCYSSL